MKNILLLSDTHSFIDSQILKYVKQADEVWHAGDIGTKLQIPLKISNPFVLFGNIDGKELRAEFPLDQKFEVEGVSVWMTHIVDIPINTTNV